MAQIVKLEPGDILVLTNLKDCDESLTVALWGLKKRLGLAYVLAFPGDVDLSKLPPGWTPPPEATSDGGAESRPNRVAPLHLNGLITAQEAAQMLGCESGDGGE